MLETGNLTSEDWKGGGRSRNSVSFGHEIW